MAGFQRPTLVLIILSLPWLSGPARAADPLPAGTLPVLRNPAPAGVSVDASQARQLTITQRNQRAILDWNSFNIARDSGVTFVQPSSSAAVLNRIHDASPSVIQGRLTANGQVYLINRNGILFDGGSQINVGGLVASSLDIGESLFNTNLLSQTDITREAFSFLGTAEQYSASFVEVAAGSELATSTGGRILLLAPRVINSGSITTPEGQTVLAGGAKVYLAAPTSEPLRGFLVEVAPYAGTDAGGNSVNLPGSVTNTTVGRILAERGNVTFAGLAVNQSGRVSATTSVNLNGSIRLLARDTPRQGADPVTQQVLFQGGRTGTLTLGENSVTEVLPDATDTKSLVDASNFSPSSVSGVAKTIHLQRGAHVTATGGLVDLSAQTDQVFQQAGTPAAAGVRVLFEEGSLIDVSGSRDVALSAERNIIEVELRGAELADSPLARDSALAKQKVYIDIRKGTPLANVTGQIEQIGRGILEKTSAGGSVTVRSEGDIVQRAGARIDISGGSLAYAPGYARVTRVESNGRVFDIGDADPTLRYTGIAGTSQVFHQRWRLTENFQRYASRRYLPGYVEGRSAGTATLVAHELVLDGRVDGHVTPGDFQRLLSTRPAAGRLVLGDSGQSTAPGSADFKLGDIVIAGARNALAGPFGLGDELPEAFRRRVELSTGQLQEGGIARVEAYGNGEVRIVAGTRLELPAGGGLTLMGRSMDVAGDIIIPSGSIALTTRDVVSAGGQLGSADVPLIVRDGVRLDVSGRWYNDHPLAGGADVGAPLALNGGRVSLSSGGDLTLGRGSIVDVSAGAWSDSAGKVTSGGAGSIVLSSGRVGLTLFDRQTSRLALDGELRGYGFTGGGSLNLRAAQVVIGAPALGDAELALAADFFRQGGFERYTIAGQDGLRVASGVNVAVLQQHRILRDGYRKSPSTANMDSLTDLVVRPEPLRTATHLSLAAPSPIFGVATLEQGALVQVADGGTLAVSAGARVRVDATLQARSGVLDLSLDRPVESDRYDAAQSLWLGGTALLDASAAVRLTTDALGRRRGTVGDGGSVRVIANKGYVIAEEGSLIDVSGRSALLDIVSSPTQRGRGDVVQVVSHGGSITLGGREGILSDGRWAAAGGGASALGGSILVSMKSAGLERIDGAPQAERVARLQTDGAVLAPGIGFGDAQPEDVYGKAIVRADRVRDSGADTLVLSALDRIELAGRARGANDPAVLDPSALDPMLTLRKALVLDAPVIRGSGLSALSAGYVGLGGNDPNTQVVRGAESGDALLSLRGNMIEVMGHVALSGFEAVALESAGDLRLRGALQRVDGSELAGSLVTAANLDLRAAQIYPSSASRFRIAAHAAEGPRTLRIGRARNDRGDATALSADGSLILEADTILQGGRVKAPFGRIEFKAAQRLALEPGSLTSVAAVDGRGEALVIPYGRTELTGRDYVYAYSDEELRLLSAVPERRITLAGPEVSTNADAVVDLRGGGDLRAYEFLPGPGGTRDVLADAGTTGAFAVVPEWGAGQGYAPYDHMIARNAGAWGMGEMIYLTAADGFPAGRYIILPARYALLPGAALVKPVSGQLDLLPASTKPLDDGSQIVAGWREYKLLGEDVYAADSRRSAFEVRPSAVFRRQSEFAETTIAAFFRDQAGTQPRDAGVLAILAGERLTLDALVRAEGGEAGRRADVDIAAPRILVTDTPGASTSSGVVELDVAGLMRLNAGSLLIGGTRSRDAGDIRIEAAAQTVDVATGGRELRAPELLLTAKDSLTIAAGATLVATGERAGPRTFRMRGDSALVALGVDSGMRLVRSDAALQAGALTIEAGARVQAFGMQELDGAIVPRGGSVVLDATGRFSSLGEVLVAEGGSLEFGVDQIRLGDVPLDTAGVDLARNRALDRLTLRSYSSVELHGNVDFSSLELKDLELQTAALARRGVDTRLKAQRITLANPGGAAAPVVPVPADGTLTIEAGEITLGAGDVALQGYQHANLVASGNLRLSGKGSLSAQQDLMLVSSALVADAGADYRLVAAGHLKTRAASGPAAAAGLGARLTMTAGTTLGHGGRILLPGGRVELHANGATGEDGVVLFKNSLIDVSSDQVAFADTLESGAAGNVLLGTTAGNIKIDAGAVVDLRGRAGGDAGTLTVSAPAGSFAWAGDVQASAAQQGSARQGRFVADLGSLSDFSLLNAQLNSAGFTQRRALRLRTGDIVVAGEDPFTQRPADRVTAREVILTADDGAIAVAGIVDASGSQGGRIVLSAGRQGAADDARDGVTLLAGGVLNARATDDPGNVRDANGQPFGTRGRGGEILLSAIGPGTMEADRGVDLRAGSVIDVSSVGVADNGSLTVRVLRTGGGAGSGAQVGDLAAALPSNAAGRGPRLAVEAVKVYTLDTPGSAELATIAADNSTFFDAARSRFAGSAFALRPGVEIRSAGDMTLTEAWNLSGLRYGEEAGTLTLRAAGNLRLAASLSDAFADVSGGSVPLPGSSWAYRLVAGADLRSADAMTTDAAATSGDIELAGGTLVRTGMGTVELASARDLVLRSGSALYTAGAPGPEVADFTARDTEAGFTRGGGDIRIAAGRDIVATPGTQWITTWYHRQGRVDAATAGNHSDPGWWSRPDLFRHGIALFGGGNAQIEAGRDMHNVAVYLPTNGRLPATFRADVDPAGLRVQGGGDLDVRAGGDIHSATFFVDRGDGQVRAGGSLGSAYQATVAGVAQPVYSLLALGDATMRIDAGGAVNLESVFNPTLTVQGLANSNPRVTYFPTYSARSGVSLVAQGGDVRLVSDEDKLAAVFTGAGGGASSDRPRLANVLYPGTVRVASLSGDLNMNWGFQMFPAARGNLDLLARGNVTLEGSRRAIGMSDVDASLLPSVFSPAQNYFAFRLAASDAGARGFATHSAPALHAGDTQPVRVVAVNGDITGPSVDSGIGQFAVLPKVSMLDAGGDIRNVFAFLQNTADADVTVLRAGRDIVFETLRTSTGRQLSNSGKIEIGGPGALLVLAGRNVDLGNSDGIVTRGNFNNPQLPERGASLLVAAGAASANTGAFAQRYVTGDPFKPIDFDPQPYDNLIGAMTALRNQPLTLDQAIDAFLALDPVTQRRTLSLSLVRHVQKVSGVAAAAEREVRVEQFFNLGRDAQTEDARRENLTAYLRARQSNPALTHDQALGLLAQLPAAEQITLLEENRVDYARRILSISESMLSGLDARFVFPLLPQAAQYPYLHRVLFEELRLSGLAAIGAKGSIEKRYARGLDAAGLLYPGASAITPVRTPGDINLFFSQIKTEQGGDIQLVAPGGLVNAGLASAGTVTKGPAQLGIVTLRGGSIQSFSREDFLVNQSRVFTLQGGDIVLWSSFGDVDAGRGAKTARATPPPQLIIRGDQFVLDTSNSVGGSGIAVLLARDGVVPGNVSLISPRGTVNAGDAGIRSAGGLEVSAAQVLGTDNINVGGIATGVSLNQNAGISAGAASAGNVGASAARGAEDVTRAASNDANRRTVPEESYRPTFINVELLGFGQ